VTGAAVPRGSAQVRHDTPDVPVYQGYYPWGYGGFGFGYYDSYYGPYGYYPFGPWPGYGGYPTYSGAYTYPDGSLRLKVKPRDGQVYVDGYFAGVVDDFDGIFQRLHLEAGPHRIEIRAPGFETLVLDVQIRWDETITVEEQLRRRP
jgi:PEGA domain-containing protein